MGNWNITIQGTGCHHNGKPEDAEKLAAQFVETAKAAGHSVQSATVITGYREEIRPDDSTSELKNESAPEA